MTPDRDVVVLAVIVAVGAVAAHVFGRSKPPPPPGPAERGRRVRHLTLVD